MKAFFIANLNARQRLYRVEPNLQGFDHVVVSTPFDPGVFGDETFIFGANAQGEVLDWEELEGSFKGGCDFERALENAGYAVDMLPPKEKRWADGPMGRGAEGSHITLTPISKMAKIKQDWMTCQLCQRKCSSASGLHSHTHSAHQMNAYAYYCFHLPALQKRIRAHVKRSRRGCWNYQGRPNSKGYRDMRIAGAPTTLVHRLSYFAYNGHLPPSEIMVLHACDNPQCCNPKHLSLGTHEDNMRERSERGRTYAPHILTESEVDDVRLRNGWGWEIPAIADYHKVSSETIRRILAGETYTCFPVKTVADF